LRYFHSPGLPPRHPSLFLKDILAECILRKKLKGNDVATVGLDDEGNVVVLDAEGNLLLSSRLAAIAPGIN
jgi:hypothetical protein